MPSVSASAPKLPARAALLRRLLQPARLVPAPVLSVALRQSLGRLLPASEIAFLEGRAVGLRVTDLDLQLVVGARDGRLCALAPDHAAEARISGDVRTFLLIAARREDPDTLFFQRRLVVEGDTELGLQAKNLLDGVELEALPGPLPWLVQRLADAVA